METEMELTQLNEHGSNSSDIINGLNISNTRSLIKRDFLILIMSSNVFTFMVQ